PGVKTSLEENVSWNALTPASVPAGARISAGKSGSVAMSLPAIADSVVNCMPVTCMPSPQSPAKRMTTLSRDSTGFEVATPSRIVDRSSLAGLAFRGVVGCEQHERARALRYTWGDKGLQSLAEPMRLSVIVPTLDEEATIASTLEKARRPGDVELVVADG